MEIVSKLPQGKFILGTREIAKAIKSGSIKNVIVAKNCPDNLIEKIKAGGDIQIQSFAGDQKELGTALGKPFCVATVGYESG